MGAAMMMDNAISFAKEAMRKGWLEGWSVSPGKQQVELVWKIYRDGESISTFWEICNQYPPSVPAPFGFYRADKQWSFFGYGVSGGITNQAFCVLVCCTNSSLKGSDFGTSGIHFSNSGLWYVLEVSIDGTPIRMKEAIGEMVAIMETTRGRMACSDHGTAPDDGKNYPCNCGLPLTIGSSYAF